MSTKKVKRKQNMPKDSMDFMDSLEDQLEGAKNRRQISEDNSDADAKADAEFVAALGGEF